MFIKKNVSPSLKMISSSSSSSSSQFCIEERIKLKVSKDLFLLLSSLVLFFFFFFTESFLSFFSYNAFNRSQLSSRPYMSTINSFLCLLGVSRAAVLFIDPYGLKKVRENNFYTFFSINISSVEQKGKKITC